MSPRNEVRLPVIGILILATASFVWGDTLITATQRGNHAISLVNITPNLNPSINAIMPLCLVGNFNPDSLLLYPHDGTLSYIYTASDSGQVRMCTPPSGGTCNVATLGQTCDVPLATDLFQNWPFGQPTQIAQLQDMALDPEGLSTALGYAKGSILVSDDYNGVTRIDIAKIKSPTVLISPTVCFNPQGIAYDASGNLFVNCGFGSAGAGTFQFDPTSGALINKTNAGYDSTNTPDGLIYDARTKLLYAASECGGFVYSIDPATLAATQMPNSHMPVTGCPDKGPDGLISNARGILYIANRGDDHVYSYDAVNKTNSVMLTAVPTIDDLGIPSATPAAITKEFVSRSITTSQTSNTGMKFTVTNPNPATDLQKVTLTDTLPAPLYIPFPAGESGSCLSLPGAKLTLSPPVPPSTALTLTIPVLPANTSCDLMVNVRSDTRPPTGASCPIASSLPNLITNPLGPNPVMNTATAGSSNAGPDQTASDCIGITMFVPDPMVLTKQFSPTKTQVGTCVAANFTVVNVDMNYADMNVQFSDTLPAGMTLCTAQAPTGSCLGIQGGTYTPSGNSSFSVTIPTLPVGGSCTLTVMMQASANASYTNTTSTITATTNAGPAPPGFPGTAALLVQPAPPTLSKRFTTNPVGIGQPATLNFAVGNPNPFTMSGIAFTDGLTGTLVVATPNGVVNGCAGSSVTAVPGTQAIVVSGISLASGASCSISVNVSSPIAGTFLNVTSTITSTDPVTVGATASDRLQVSQPPPDGAYQVNYATNLNAGDAYVNISNVGALAGTDPAGIICANVYVFDPAEEPVSCCSCPITPNGLRSLSVQRDLIGNPFTPATPNAVVIKLVASTPVAGSCDASLVTEYNLVRGMAAWRTSLQTAPTTPATFQPTEMPFVPSYLSRSEMQKLSAVCGFIQTYASGFGMCNACKPVAQGANKRP